MHIPLIITLIILIVILWIVINKTEKFASDNTTVDNNKIGTKKPVNNLLEDPLFSDVIIYDNDVNPYPPNGSLGIDKCINTCNGTCVEFGVTGKGWCFPNV